jgi:hypothetical protein
MRYAGIEKSGYSYQHHIAEATASWFIRLLTGARAIVFLLDLNHN